jgi:hypothetical protein
LGTTGFGKLNGFVAQLHLPLSEHLFQIIIFLDGVTLKSKFPTAPLKLSSFLSQVMLLPWFTTCRNSSACFLENSFYQKHLMVW